MRKENWLSPLNKMIWVKAFQNRATEMTIRDGRKFTIKYSTQRLYGEPADMAWVRSEQFDGPCGWFPVKKVLDPIWLTVEEKEVREINSGNPAPTWKDTVRAAQGGKF
jgi:hypothetical protein